MGLREAKRTSTRSAIEQAAWTLAAQQPWAEVTVDDIAAAAGIARRTFFNYYESKDQLLRELTPPQPVRLLAAIREVPDGVEPWDAMSSAVAGLMAGQPRESIERIRALWREPALLEQNVAGRGQLERDLVAEIRRRRPPVQIADAVLVAAVFITASRAAIQSWVDEGEHGRARRCDEPGAVAGQDRTTRERLMVNRSRGRPAHRCRRASRYRRRPARRRAVVASASARPRPAAPR